jgi:hypothetical protein
MGGGKVKRAPGAEVVEHRFAVRVAEVGEAAAQPVDRRRAGALPGHQGRLRPDPEEGETEDLGVPNGFSPSRFPAVSLGFAEGDGGGGEQPERDQADEEPDDVFLGLKAQGPQPILSEISPPDPFLPVVRRARLTPKHTYVAEQEEQQGAGGRRQQRDAHRNLHQERAGEIESRAPEKAEKEIPGEFPDRSLDFGRVGVDPEGK